MPENAVAAADCCHYFEAVPFHAQRTIAEACVNDDTGDNPVNVSRVGTIETHLASHVMRPALHAFNVPNFNSTVEIEKRLQFSLK
jgi:hypothetical protein